MTPQFQDHETEKKAGYLPKLKDILWWDTPSSEISPMMNLVGSS